MHFAESSFTAEISLFRGYLLSVSLGKFIYTLAAHQQQHIVSLHCSNHYRNIQCQMARNLHQNRNLFQVDIDILETAVLPIDA